MTTARHDARVPSLTDWPPPPWTQNIPIDDNTADCVMSNCVLNLVVRGTTCHRRLLHRPSTHSLSLSRYVQPDKQKAFREIHRILKPGGRLAASDIALKQPLPEELWYTTCTHSLAPHELSECRSSHREPAYLTLTPPPPSGAI